MASVKLMAPLSGWVVSLAEVPDPAFAQGLIGDGVAIDPTSSELRAPCDGEVLSVHRARHACTMRAANGAEILLHIGIDTVELGGRGFKVLVANGQRVRAGDPLIRFDIDLLARKAKSLHTAVVLLNGDAHAVLERVVNREVAVGEVLLSVNGKSPPGPGPEHGGGADGAERQVQLLIAHGLHARPAAAFVRRAKQHAGDVTVLCRGRTANGKSLVLLMALDARHGDTLTIRAGGAEAERTAGELAALVTSGLGDPIVAPAAQAPARAEPEPVALLAGREITLDGVGASSGLALGRAVRLASTAAPVASRDGLGVAFEEERLTSALGRLRGEIEQTIARTPTNDPARAEIFRAHLDLLDDPELVQVARREIAAGRGAAFAWQSAIDASKSDLARTGNPLLAERTGDLEDLGRRALALLAGQATARVPADLPDGAVLVAEEILPSDLASVARGRLAGLCSARGGATSHAAILAAGLGVPAVVAIGDAVLGVPDGAPLIVDGDAGRAIVFPADLTRTRAERAIGERGARRRANLAAARQPGRTADGTAVAVLANLGRVADTAGAVEQGAEGCGLLRTEFLFLDRATAPSEEEQLAAYQAVADALAGRPLVVRLLDGGGDKPLAFLSPQPEDNPALGVRGVRLALRHPAVLRAQLRAILRVKPAGACHILVPMVAAAAELAAVRAVLDEERRSLGVAAPVPLGAMIEVPVAALLAGEIARAADFFSIGTNDLAQYALAMDRGNPLVAPGLDNLNPGVLRLIASAAAGARAHGRPVTVCGGAAGDPRAAPLLVGLGVGALSMAPALIPELKAQLRGLTASRCAEIAERALELGSGEAVRDLVAQAWPELATNNRTTDRRQTW